MVYPARQFYSGIPSSANIGKTSIKRRSGAIEILGKLHNNEAVALTDDYLKELQKRSSESRVYKKYQLVGLEIAEFLKDEEHKSLYIKLAKQNDPERLLGIAKEISQNKNVKNKGAYFMKIWKTK